jgi:hypothetical protein
MVPANRSSRAQPPRGVADRWASENALARVRTGSLALTTMVSTSACLPATRIFGPLAVSQMRVTAVDSHVAVAVAVEAARQAGAARRERLPGWWRVFTPSSAHQGPSRDYFWVVARIVQMAAAVQGLRRGCRPGQANGGHARRARKIPCVFDELANTKTET